ncbi:MAG: hypothetical protein JXB32_15115 [Deltaproteobacteria bacterium]|nr:hypothetical protein [Deltaproteobacteria bacterium]
MTNHDESRVRASRDGRRGRPWTAALGLAVLAALAPDVARADDPFETTFSPSPNVLLLLDTSGSMEYLREEHKVPCCIQGDPLCNDPAKRTRWMMVQDALLGPVSDASFHCLRFWSGSCVKLEFDEDCDSAALRDLRFHIPADWVIPQFQAYGERNVPYGILERYRERVRFGAAFFDSLYSGQTDVSGMFSYTNSYGEPYVLRGHPIDVGIRARETPSEPVFGALTHWGGDDTDINELNEQVRRELEESFRYCGSPVSAALDDVRHFFANDPANIDGGTDRYADCRERAVVLITDGVPNSGEGNPYAVSAEAARALYTSKSLGLPLYVVGLTLCPATTAEGIDQRVVLDQIACEGCPDGDPRCPSPCGICDAQDTDQLIGCLDSILHRVSAAGVTSRTLAVVTNQISEDDPAEVIQWQFNTGLVPQSSRPWTGILERSAYVCDSTGTVVPDSSASKYVDYGAVLNARTSERALRTVTTPATGPRKTPYAAAVDLEDFDTTNPNLTAEQLGCESGECTDATFVSGTVDYIHGRTGTARAGNRLADIYHASVSVTGRPNLEIPIVSYYAFQEANWTRHQVVYAATNDGVLHAFRASNTTNPSDTGEELWGYVPNYLVPRVHDQIQGGHIANLDSTPVVRDMRMFKGAETTASSDQWRTVLVGGYRQGGRGYYALDITDPATPKLLWEINHTTDDDSTPLVTNDYEDLWLTYATPFVGTAFTVNHDLSGGPQLGELAVAIFPGGFNPTAPVTSNTGLYVVSLNTGRLVQQLMPRYPSSYACGASPDCEARPECCAQLVTSPVGYGAVPGMVTTRVFVGDDRGRIWRADLAATDPDDWSLDLFYPHPDPPSGEPTPAYRIASDVKFPPALALNKQNELVVIYGTGDVDDTGRLDENYMVSVTERIEYDSTASRYIGRAYHNWTLCPLTDSSTACLDLDSITDVEDRALTPGEKLTGVPIVFDQVAYFSTFVPFSNPANACEMGEGRIWGVQYDYKDENETDDLAGWAALEAVDPVTGVTLPEQLFQSYDDTYVAGLTVVQRPSCFEDTTTTPPSPGLGSASRESFEVVAQVSRTVDALPPGRQVNTATIRIPTPTIMNYADSWGGVFE